MTKEIEAKGIRKIIAERMLESWHTSPRVSYSVTTDTAALKIYRDNLNQKYIARGFKVTYNHLLIKICGIVLTEFPYVNASFDGKTIMIHDDVNIGLAVAVENGLMVPNIKKVQGRDIGDLVNEVDRLILGAKTMKLKYDDITGGTFTITNLGMFGIENFSPIINQPELAILGVNAIIDKPIVIKGEIVIRPMMILNLIADHRVIDGVYAANVLSRVKELIENPEKIDWE